MQGSTSSHQQDPSRFDISCELDGWVSAKKRKKNVEAFHLTAFCWSWQLGSMAPYHVGLSVGCNWLFEATSNKSLMIPSILLHFVLFQDSSGIQKTWSVVDSKWRADLSDLCGAAHLRSMMRMLADVTRYVRCNRPSWMRKRGRGRRENIWVKVDL